MSTFQRFNICSECHGSGYQINYGEMEVAPGLKVKITSQGQACELCKGTGKVDIVDEIELENKAIREDRIWMFVGLVAVLLLIAGINILFVFIIHKPDDIAALILSILAGIGAGTILYSIFDSNRQLAKNRRKVTILQVKYEKPKRSETSELNEVQT